ncbi:ion channel [Polaribacter marinivivus]|uniref:Ion channel n=1 Tax=Polaribacter marinivivus TaxID=1524260 RepID=A0ABV8RB39_9FLAO
MIEEEKDSVFKLENAIVKYKEASDSIYQFKPLSVNENKYNRIDTIYIHKELSLQNVQFIPFPTENFNSMLTNYDFKGFGFNHINFKKKVTLRNTLAVLFNECVFENTLTVNNNDPIVYNIYDYIKKNENRYNSESALMQTDFILNSSELRKGISFLFDLKNTDNLYEGEVEITNSKIWKKPNSVNLNAWSSDIKCNNLLSLNINNLTFYNQARIYNINGRYFNFTENKFEDITYFYFSAKNDKSNIKIKNNIFKKYVVTSLNTLTKSSEVDWDNFSNKLINSSSFNEYFYTLRENEKIGVIESYKKLEKLDNKKDSLINIYKNSYLLSHKSALKKEVQLRVNYYDFYKSQQDLESSNALYIEYKDLLLMQSKLQYKQNPSFETFFKWRINQFLKVFSAYGTKPEKAVIFSLYVILLFAFIYLLFPNSWDTLGKKRLIHRFEFFQKYLRRNEGMHTIYLEDKQQEISSYEAFKTNLEKAHLELPSFFITWSKPLYNASMFSSRITSRFLKTTDVLHGKWKDLSPKQKRWKNIQIGLLLTVGLLYDLFIKALNALMLSINTFTTLGFGEIPIKGLPRYLAIIQGFIGWFMLTIFSVSLISQLLN